MLKISKALYEDLEKILELQKDCYLDEAEIYDDYEIPPLTQTLQSIQNDFEQHTFLKGEVDGNIFASVKGLSNQKKCEVGRLIVDRKHRNNGYGRMMMRAIEDEFPDVRAFELFTGSKSERNLHLYQKIENR